MTGTNYPYVGPVAHSSGNGNLPIGRIVVHCTAGADAKGARGTARYFQDPNATGSAHAITDANELVISAHDDVICWHAPPNTHSIGIEICCSLSGQGKGHWELASHQVMLKKAAIWVAEKAKLHGVPVVRLNPDALLAGKHGICGHVDVSLAFHQSTHEDPGPYFPWSQFMALVQAEYDRLGGKPGTTTPEDTLSAAEVTEIKSYIEERTKAYANFDAKNLTQQLSTLLVNFEALDQKYAVAVNNFASQLDAANDAALAAVAAKVDALSAKVDKLPK